MLDSEPIACGVARKPFDLVIDDKGSGKTSFIFSCLSSNADYVSNEYKSINTSDEVWLISKEDKAEIEWYDLNQYFNTSVQYSWNNVHAVVFPNLAKNNLNSITTLSQKECKGRLLSNNLSTYIDNNTGPWLDIAKGDKAQIDLVMNDTLNELSRSIKSYEVQFDGKQDSFCVIINKLVDEINRK